MYHCIGFCRRRAGCCPGSCRSLHHRRFRGDPIGDGRRRWRCDDLGAPIAVAGGLRTISVNTVGSDLPGQLTTVTSNGDFLDVANSSRVSAAIDITYTLGAVGGFEDFTVGTLSLIFEANNPANAVDTTFAIDFVGGGNFSIGPVVVPAIDTPTPFDIPLTKAQLDALTGGGTLSLKVNGGNGYDFGLKIVGIQAPEPGSILLLGAGLLGLGLASRRKRA
ncbi:PEP-CTERM sorting domain-containing protein [Hankyongella ginsenosidimutans]|uniref:PEP-CTERM sorting domain-containing protein n=1 Tax=Hankyongella ginsenosidimutans TaxID=1763828 RepID=A0A4D7C8E6_9SPHN|nr:PEP-CTERM sorting domain-containing protein [Hankyongella ginsenosidimutans]